MSSDSALALTDFEKLPYFEYFGGGQFCVRGLFASRRAAVLDHISGIFGRGCPTQIIGSVVGLTSVAMRDFVFRRGRWPVKNNANKAMDEKTLMSIIISEVDGVVAVPVGYRLQYAALENHNATTSESISGSSDATTIADLVRPAFNRAPFFGYDFVSHARCSYSSGG